MKPTLARTVLAAVLAAAAGTAFAQHAERCEPIPKEEWKPQAELERRLTNQGWKISRVKITNGCYEVYGRDERNQRVETFFNPKTFEVVTAPK
ncbi:PepSY domain-containing protein [Piscinibacter koreensis]|uniref:PepSY domain-containing protein n=1 Tax=Piscinibacter koreensis TaxID=2742824 RepID=A0A7Y6NJX9_9BURK|nr:PepSY domain-containing protein [Schlegelella koreensis]NUZ04466.1 PepSY domain-containing protein [Schlegelella koreensis]